MNEAHANNKKVVTDFYLKLDKVLKMYFEEFDEKLHLDVMDNFFMFRIKEAVDLTEKEWDIVVNKLKKDKYLIDFPRIGTTSFLGLSDEGILFWNDGQGGYVKKFEAERIEAQRRADLEQSIIDISNIIEKNQKGQEKTNKTTLYIAGAAILISLLQLITTLYKEEKPQLYLIDNKKNTHHSHEIPDKEVKTYAPVLSNKSGDTIKK
jgi:hypothetical protein